MKNMILIFNTILNYLLFLIKLILLSAVISIPITFICSIFEKEYNVLYKKNKNQILTFYILIYLVVMIFLIILYFLPLIIASYDFTFLEIIVNIFKLIIINLLLSAIVLVFAIISLAIYEKLNKNNKKFKNKLNAFNLWKSNTLVIIIMFIIYILFPNILPLILYIIYL
jgi:hypothetical protein